MASSPASFLAGAPLRRIPSAASPALDELRTRARVRLNTARREGVASDGKLADRLNEVAHESGFRHWDHARRVLGGLAVAGDDWGDFWHVPRTGITPNLWFARHDEAAAVLAGMPEGYLLPYRRQCFIVQQDFVRELGMDPADAAWAALGRDLVAGYGTRAWHALAFMRARASQESFATS